MTQMSNDEAEIFARDVIALLLKHQESPLGVAPLGSEESAQEVAKTIAAFRKTLIEELMKP